MNYALFAVFEAGASVEDLFLALHHEGFNGTYLNGASLNTLIHSSASDDEPSFISLHKALSYIDKNNATFFLVVEEKKLERVRKLIHDYTDGFTRIKGGLFAWPLAIYEASF
jgi:hypothetical protein